LTPAETNRRVHLVGTVPAESTQEAFRLVSETVGDRITDWLPDGETGNRKNWIGRLVDSLGNHPDLELAKEGDWSDYESTPGFKVKKNHEFTLVDLDYFEHFEASWTDFQEVRSDWGRPDLAFQVGIPGPVDVAFAAFGSIRWRASSTRSRSRRRRYGRSRRFMPWPEIRSYISWKCRSRWRSSIGCPRR
jgi:hypothetical protein